MPKDQTDDYRQIMTVFLMRDGRNKYWEFHCPYCMAKVCDVDGTMVHLRDVSYDSGQNPQAVKAVKCSGTKKIWCRYWFTFQLVN